MASDDPWVGTCRDEFVKRLLRMFQLKDIYGIQQAEVFAFGRYKAFVGRDTPSGTSLLWCQDDTGTIFFKMADNCNLVYWDERVNQALITLRAVMLLDDLSDA